MLRNYLITTILLFASVSVFAGSTEQPNSIFDKMAYTEVLEMELKVSLNPLIENRRSEEDYIAKLSFSDKNGDTQEWDTKVSLRGKFRRMKCEAMPPLKLKFKKDDLKEAGLSSSNDLKMVTPCVGDKKVAKELLLREYLTYKLYNQITDYSYRVQLVKVLFKDPLTGDSQKHWAFLIEDTAQLRERLSLEKVKRNDAFGIKNINTSKEKTAAVFQYIIGNCDWGFANKKNLKVLRQGNQIIGVPYDFDFAGIVAAPYARANSGLGIKTRFDRVYIGMPYEKNEMSKTLDLFEEKKEILISTIKNFAPLSRDARKDMIQYIERFYEEDKQLVTKAQLLASK